MNYGIDENENKKLYYRKLTNDKVINITGEGGAGKSTLCEAFRKRDDCVVVDLDLVSINNKRVGTLEYELVCMLIEKYGTELFSKPKRSVNKSGSIIDDEAVMAVKKSFSIIYPEVVNYLKQSGKTVVVDGSQLRFIDDSSKIQGEFIVIRTSLKNCINQSLKRWRTHHPDDDENKANKYLEERSKILRALNPYLNETINGVAALQITPFDNQFKKQLNTQLESSSKNILAKYNSSLTLEQSALLSEIIKKKIVVMDNFGDLIPGLVNADDNYQQLLAIQNISSRLFFVNTDNIYVNLDALYLNNYSKIEDIVDLFENYIKDYLKLNTLEQTMK